MNLGLLIFRRTTRLTKRKLFFAIVDYDKSGTYPSNFLCQLPNFNCRPCLSHEFIFSQLFRNKEKEIASKLLTEALEKKQDPEIELAIKRRLITLSQKSWIILQQSFPFFVLLHKIFWFDEFVLDHEGLLRVWFFRRKSKWKLIKKGEDMRETSPLPLG